MFQLMNLYQPQEKERFHEYLKMSDHGAEEISNNPLDITCSGYQLNSKEILLQLHES